MSKGRRTPTKTPTSNGRERKTVVELAAQKGKCDCTGIPCAHELAAALLDLHKENLAFNAAIGQYKAVTGADDLFTKAQERRIQQIIDCDVVRRMRA